MSRKAEVILEYQNYIENPPIQPEKMYGNACRNDDITVESWRNIWLGNMRANKKRFGSFKSKGVGQLFDVNKLKPAIIAGSGPSLKVNGHLLKDRGGIPLISCLHNFHFFEDRGVEVDYYVTLDAGEIVIDEVSEGGENAPDWYWERTKGKKLVAFIGSSPKLFEKWQGEVYLYNAPVPDKSFQEERDAIEPFYSYISNGGNVLGACLYLSRLMGSPTVAFTGADFCFSYDKKFHAWDSKYDANIGHVMRTVDVYGMKVLTWSSYAAFKSWFDYVAVRVPGTYYNCSEGGTFGAYPEGNLMAVRQMELKDFLEMNNINQLVKEQFVNPDQPQNAVLF